MSNHSLTQNTLGHDDPILRRTGHGLGVSWMGVEGTLGGEGFRIKLQVTIPKRLEVLVKFPRQQIEDIR